MKAPKVFLETERLRLRRFTQGDDRNLFDLDSDPEVMRHISKGEPTPLAKIQLDILPRLLAYYAVSETQGFWVAELLPGHDFIGWFHLRWDKLEPSEMELGYRLKRSLWGRGLATEGSSALLRKGFEEMKYPKICARTLVHNLASQRVMQKIGLHFERHFTYPPEIIPGWSEADRSAIKYSLTAEQYTTLINGN